MKTIRTDTLEIAFEKHGPADGWPVILSHGFPYDVRAYDKVAPTLASSGAHVIVPTCAASVRPDSSRARRCAAGSTRRSAVTSSGCSTD